MRPFNKDESVDREIDGTTHSRKGTGKRGTVVWLMNREGVDRDRP